MGGHRREFRYPRRPQKGAAQRRQHWALDMSRACQCAEGLCPRPVPACLQAIFSHCSRASLCCATPPHPRLRSRLKPLLRSTRWPDCDEQSSPQELSSRGAQSSLIFVELQRFHNNSWISNLLTRTSRWQTLRDRGEIYPLGMANDDQQNVL